MFRGLGIEEVSKWPIKKVRETYKSNGMAAGVVVLNSGVVNLQLWGKLWREMTLTVYSSTF